MSKKSLKYLLKIFYSRMDFRICIKFTSSSLCKCFKVRKIHDFEQHENLDFDAALTNIIDALSYLIGANGFVF